MTRRDRILIAETTTALLIGLATALPMLANATESGGHQWATGAALGTGLALVLVMVYAIVVGCDAAVRYVRRLTRRTVTRAQMTSLATGRRRTADPTRPDTVERWLAGAPTDVPPVDPAARVRPRIVNLAADTMQPSPADAEWDNLLGAVGAWRPPVSESAR